MRNVLTFDVEDWYQGLDMAHAHWTGFERRLSVGLEFILERLSGAGVRATFFVLGMTAREQPQWVQRIAEQGHEIGTHGWSHTPIYRQSRQQFRAELCRSLALLQDLTGRQVCGHRAAFFSITLARTCHALLSSQQYARHAAAPARGLRVDTRRRLRERAV